MRVAYVDMVVDWKSILQREETSYEQQHLFQGRF